MARIARIAACMVVLGGFFAVAAAPAAAVNLPAGFRDEVVLTDIPEPTALAFAPDGRVFVAQKEGKVLVFNGLADESPEVFADLRTEVYDTGDRGLLGLALDPGFPVRPYVYVLYTYDHVLGEGGGAPRWGLPNQAGDGCSEPNPNACLVSGRLVRLTAENDKAVGATPLVEDWCQQFASHSIGDLQFDSQGRLYASGGDGADFDHVDYGQWGSPVNPCGDPPGEGGALRSQDLRTSGDPLGLNGTVIRIDPDSGAGVAGNPLFGSLDGNARRILGYGFRNPFRMEIAPDGQVYVGNVGWNLHDEIDRFDPASGQLYNSGWPCYEGLGPEPGYLNAELKICEDLEASPGVASEPFFPYGHMAPTVPEDRCERNAGAALSGMTFYPGGGYPAAYDGALFFSDSVRGCIYVMFPGEDGRPDPLSTTNFLAEGAPYPGIDLELGPGGDLFYAKLFGDAEEGTIHRIHYDPDAPVANLTVDPQWGAEDPLEVHLDAGKSSDPQEEPLSFAWDLDENGTFETPGQEKRTAIIGGDDENHTVAVQVTDEGGKSGVARVLVYPGNTPPEISILEPDQTLDWRVGQQIDFAGSADDKEDGSVDVERLYWKTRMLHCPSACHAHPMQYYPGVESGEFVTPDHEYPAHIELVFTATDSRDLSTTESVVIDARAVDLSIESDPTGVGLTAGQVSGTAPFPVQVLEGGNLVLSAPQTALLGGDEYVFGHWSDGGARVHTIVADESGTYTASYVLDTGGGPHAEGPPGGQKKKRRPPRNAGKGKIVLRRHPPKVGDATSARFAFRLDGARGRFRCRIDSQPFRPCRSPRVYKNLALGRHAFRVMAVDGDGGRIAPTAAFKWRVVPPLRWKVAPTR
jgi:glucose/arabinose dehydrogenase